MKTYTHIKKEERDEISILFSKGYYLRDIAGVLGRDVVTVSREIARNRRRSRDRDNAPLGAYTAHVADHKAYVRRKYAKCQYKKIRESKELLVYIKAGLKREWSPDVISGRMRLEQRPFYASKTAIYEYLYSQYGQSLCQLLISKRYQKKHRDKPKVDKVLIPNRVGIEYRSADINTRKEYGHFEEDTIVSGKKHSTTTALAVLLERKSRYISAKKIDSLKPDVHNQAVVDMSYNLALFTSCTFDNGIENTRHQELQIALHINTFFCDTYASWQKGGVENVNKLLRRKIPKGCNINDFSDEYIQKIVEELNNIPRKSLGYKTPYEVMKEQNLLNEDRSKMKHKISQKKRAIVALQG